MTSLFATYAIEPEVFEDWHNVRLLLSDLGWDEGRLVATVPEATYRDKIKAALQRSRDSTKAHIAGAELKRRLRSSWVSAPRNTWFSPDRDWLEEVEHYHQSNERFRAVIASDNPRERGFVVTASELSDLHEDWQVSRGVEVDRHPEELAHVLAPLLKQGPKITLVDPHFDPCKRKFREFLAAIMSRAVDRPDEHNPSVEFIYHSRACDQPGDDPDPPRSEFPQYARRHLIQLIPDGCELTLKRWRERTGTDFHDRFIMNSDGGVKIGAGLSKQSSDGEKANVLLLDQALFRAKKNKFRQKSSPLELIDSTTLPAE